MSVNANALENAERDLNLSSREGEGKPSKRENAAAELKALLERIKRYDFDRTLQRKEILAHDKAPHCGDCFSRGWVAAIEAIKGDGTS